MVSPSAALGPGGVPELRSDILGVSWDRAGRLAGGCQPAQPPRFQPRTLTARHFPALQLFLVLPARFFCAEGDLLWQLRACTLGSVLLPHPRARLGTARVRVVRITPRFSFQPAGRREMGREERAPGGEENVPEGHLGHRAAQQIAEISPPVPQLRFTAG